jgi:nitroreductase
MDFSKLITARYSVRAYKPDPVPVPALEYILDAARLAPTAANKQPFRLIVVHTPGREQEMRRIYRRGWFIQAPIIICACIVPEEGWVRGDGRRYWDVDVAIVFDHLILAAADQGLGTCWIANFDAKAAREVLRLPDTVEPFLVTPLGYPADEPKSKLRRPLSELVHYEQW